MNKETMAILNAIAEDRDSIPYRKRLNKITGWVTASILLQQILYWAQREQFKPFYKFRAPCKHKWYKAGDSWTEELGFTPAEFDTAIKKIATKITTGTNKADAYKGTTPQHLVIYWTDSSRVSWYHLNVKLLGNFIMSIYLEDQESEDTLKSDNDELPSSETTPETTPETTSEDTPAQKSFKALATLCQYDLKTIDKGQRGKLNQAEKKLRKAGATPDLILSFGDWWYRFDWRGKKEEAPEPHQVCEEWGRFIHWRKKREAHPTPQEKEPMPEYKTTWQSAMENGLSIQYRALIGAAPTGRDNGAIVLEFIDPELMGWCKHHQARIEKDAGFGVRFVLKGEGA